MNDEVGNNFPADRFPAFGRRRDPVRNPKRILIADPVLGSRFALAHAVRQPGYQVEMASTKSEALGQLENGSFALILVERDLDRGTGLEFLTWLRTAYAKTPRALVTSEGTTPALRSAIEEAGLSFLIMKPWDGSALRRTIREVLGAAVPFEGWSQISTSPSDSVRSDSDRSAGRVAGREDDILLRGLLAGLNSCETESELYRLLQTELGANLGSLSWLWVDEKTATATRVESTCDIERGIDLLSLSLAEERLVARARATVGVSRIDSLEYADALEDPSRICLGVEIRNGAGRTVTGLVWAERARVERIQRMLVGLHEGLERAFRRIRIAQARATAARGLARRVSEELRTPVGALTHAIDRLRGEAERAGLSTEWVDRVSTESRRVARAVAHVEDEMRLDASGSPPTSTSS